jgi:hypothetical protein
VSEQLLYRAAANPCASASASVNALIRRWFSPAADARERNGAGLSDLVKTLSVRIGNPFG